MNINTPGIRSRYYRQAIREREQKEKALKIKLFKFYLLVACSVILFVIGMIFVIKQADRQIENAFNVVSVSDLEKFYKGGVLK